MASCSHLDSVTVTEAPGEIAGCEDCLKIGGTLGAPAHVPGVRPHRLLRQLAEPPRHRAHPRDRASDHPLGRARRGLELVLRRRGDVPPAPAREPGPAGAVRSIGRRLEPGDHRLRDFLTRAAQPFEWLEAGTPEADALLRAHGARGRRASGRDRRRRHDHARRHGRALAAALAAAAPRPQRALRPRRSSAPGRPGSPPPSTRRPTGSRRS